MAFVAGLFGGLFAAAMSSMDSGINSIATVIVNDFIKPLRRKQQSEHHDVKLARILTLALGVLGMLVACYATTLEQILKASQTFLGLFSGPVLGLFLLGVLTKRATFKGWVVGAVAAIAGTVYIQNYTEVHFIYYFPFCFGVNFTVGYLASAILKSGKTPAELTVWGRHALKRHTEI